MNLVLALLVLAALTLLGGAFVLWRKGAPPKQPVLMVVLAAIMLANVLIWTLPDGSGEAPIDMAGTFDQQ